MKPTYRDLVFAVEGAASRIAQLEAQLAEAVYIINEYLADTQITHI